jgi:hypothetical protein
MSSTEPDLPARIPCRECGQEILETARVCGFCESYQARWRNELRYYANITGIFTFIGTAIFFSITLAPSFRRAVSWEDRVEVLRVDGGQFTLANAGDGNVFIYEIVLDWPTGVLTRSVNDTLGTGTILQMEGNRYHLYSDDALMNAESEYLRVLSRSDTLWAQADSGAFWDVNIPLPSGDYDLSCFQIIPLSRGGNYWNRVERFLGREPSSVPLEGRVRAFSLDRGRIFESRFEVEGLLFHVIERTRGGEGLLTCEVY